MWGRSKKAAVGEPGSESSPEPGNANTPTSDFYPTEELGNKFLLFKPWGYDILLWEPEQTKTGIESTILPYAWKTESQKYLWAALMYTIIINI